MCDQLGFREVVPHQSAGRRWKDININTGAAQSTLQDIKLPECAGGFAYNDSNRAGSVTRNRFIYWKISHDVLELSEQSLDFNLSGNNVRFRFQDTPVLEGVSVHETNSHVVVLVATVSSVHRLMFTHPTSLQPHDYVHVQSVDQTLPSVFVDASVTTARDPANFYVLIPSSVGTSLPHTAASWLTSDNEAIFAIASSPGRILMVCLPRPDSRGIVSTNELRQSSTLQRLWSGIIPSAIRGTQDPGDMSLGLCLHTLNNQVFLFTLCRDSKLRVWSCSDYECVMTADILDQLPEAMSQYRKQQGPQPHMMRKALGSTQNCLYLGVYLCFADRKQICVVKPGFVLGQYQLDIIAIVHVPDYHLLDFCLTMTHIWGLWTTNESETVLNFMSFEEEISSGLGWIPATLQPPMAREFQVPEGFLEPREAFMENIFTPGNFSVQTITKAINIYRRSVETAFMGEINVPVNVLKEEVCCVVENEIHSQASEYELTDDSYLQLQLECWAKFYSCCIQYQDVETKMMGLMIDHNTGMVGVIKKSVFSLLRPQDPVEFLVLSQGLMRSEDSTCLAALSDDAAMCNDLVALSKCLAFINSQQSDDMKDAFEHDLYHQQSPDTIAPVMLNNLLTNPDDSSSPHFHLELTRLACTIPHLLEAIEIILVTIDLAHGEPRGLVVDEGLLLEASRQLNCSRLFSSQIGASLIAESVRQVAQVRLSLCRDLLIFLFWLQQAGAQADITSEEVYKIICDLIPQACTLTQAYHILLWSSKTVGSDVARNTMESGLCQLSLLNVTDSVPPFSKLQKSPPQPVTLVELFVQQEGGTQARMLLSQNHFLDDEMSTTWTKALSPLIFIVGQLLWPVSINFAFAEFLLVHCQYMQLSEYGRLLQNWCKWNSCSRKFLLGHVYLNLNDPDKATDQFLEAVHGVNEEEFFLVNKVLQAHQEPPSQLTSLYFITVIRLFEQFLLADQIITLAKAAIGMAENGDPNVPTLWSVVFKFHLELHHNEEAFSAINANPDISRKKDCLRQFVVVLCERSQYKTLVEFPYIELRDDLVNILESRARSVDLTTHNYYDLLYAFHIFRGNYRKAGAIMYEHGMRLGKEVPGLKGIQRQVKCYLAALNCLRLVKPNYAWIVKPVPFTGAGNNDKQAVKGMSPKRTYDGDEITESTSSRQMEVLELDHIKKEYDLLHSRLQLYHQNQDLTNITGILTSDETVGLLVNAGLYDTSFHVCSIFGLSFKPVFEGLTSRCTKLSQLSQSREINAQILDEAWNWLAKNDLSKIRVANETNIADFGWKLLETYVKRYELTGQTVQHRCVASKLLSLGGHLPHWLLVSYKLRNAAELLMVYIEYDMLEDAAALVLEYIDAVMGKGNEYFGMKSVLHPNAPPVWLPYTAIDHLLEALSEQGSDPGCHELYNDIQTKLDEYYNTLDPVSRDMILLKQQSQKAG